MSAVAVAIRPRRIREFLYLNCLTKIEGKYIVKTPVLGRTIGGVLARYRVRGCFIDERSEIATVLARA
ncbi:MAG: hypothetical protein LBK66_11010 [Spirochaetaceae bacterium]|jgi:hypothetical protein|nr:hypothetical protein [Spirochaetaceae bacterium]